MCILEHVVIYTVHWYTKRILRILNLKEDISYKVYFERTSLQTSFKGTAKTTYDYPNPSPSPPLPPYYTDGGHDGALW